MMHLYAAATNKIRGYLKKKAGDVDDYWIDLFFLSSLLLSIDP